MFTIAHSQKIFTGWLLISGDAMHPILLKTRTNPAPFPNKARGRVKPTALSSHPKHRHDWYKSLAGVFAAPVCLAQPIWRPTRLMATLPVKCGAASLPKEAPSVTARPSKAVNRVAAILRQLRLISTLTSWERQAPQFRCKLIGPLEFLLCVGFLTLLTKRQGEIVVCLGVAWLQA